MWQLKLPFFKVQIALSAFALVLMLKKIKSIDDSIWTCAEKLTCMELSAWRVVGIFLFFFYYLIGLVFWFF